MRLFTKAIFTLLLLSSTAFAITIDKLEASQSVSQSVSGSVGTSVTATTSIGGTRNITVRKTGGSGAVSLAINPDNTPSTGDENVDHNQGTTALGRTTITWDGDTTPNAVKDSFNSVLPQGLGNAGVDFTKDNADKFLLRVLVDYGLSGTLYLKMRVFDAVQSTGGLFFFSEAVIPFTADVTTPTIIEVPYSSFSIGSGSDGAASFTRIGAVQLIIDGTSAPASDMIVEIIKTNGRCELLPINGVILGDCDYCADQTQPKNECGQCESTPAGPNPNYRANCRDCLGVMCVLQGDPRNALCTDTNTLNSCGICDADPNNDTPDLCGVCGGNNLSCAGCDGVPNSGLVRDICGVCGGNGTSCLDCAGNPFGSVTVDNCGVCGGINACNDCAGTPNGTKVKDRCGVCGGDGQSCVECETQDMRPLSFTLDAQAKQQENTATRMLVHLKQVQKTPAVAAYSKKIAAQIRKLQLRNWILSWSIELDNTQCVDPTTSVKPTFCTERTVNTTQIDEYRKNANTLYKLTREIAAKLRNASKKLTAIAARGDRDGKRKLDKALELADQVPLKATVCN